MPPSPSQPQKLIAAERAEQIVALRAAGMNISSIARQMNLSRRWVQMVLNKHLANVARRTAQHSEAALGLSLERLDAAIRVAYAKMLSRDLAPELQLKAIDRVLALEQRRAKLLGLDAPEKVAPTTPDGQRPYEGVSDEERAARIAELLAKANPETS